MTNETRALLADVANDLKSGRIELAEAVERFVRILEAVDAEKGTKVLPQFPHLIWVYPYRQYPSYWQYPFDRYIPHITWTWDNTSGTVQSAHTKAEVTG